MLLFHVMLFKLNFTYSLLYFFPILHCKNTQVIYQTNDLILLARYKKVWSFVDENDRNILKRCSV